MIVSSVTAPLLGMVDTAVMGHLDRSWYLGAVAVGATIFSVLFMGLNFLRMGTTGLTAQAFGAVDRTAMREVLAQAMVTAIILAAAIILLRDPVATAALSLLKPSDEVAELAQVYFHIRVFSAPASLANFVLIGWLLGMQNARGPLAIMLSINLSNIVLDILLVVYAGMTVDGVAWATLMAELIGVAVGAFFVRAELSRNPGSWSAASLGRLSRYGRLLSINASLFLRTMALMFVFAFMTAQGARLGNAVLAANAVLLNFQWFLSYALDGIANAAESLVGKAVGARDRAGMLLAVRRTLHWSLLLAAGFFAVYWLFGEAVIDMLTGIESIRSSAREFLPWLIVSPLISVWSFLYDGVYVGATRSREMMAVMVGSVLLLFLPAWFVFEDLGNHALWLAFMTFMAGRAAGMHFWFTGRLAHRLVPPDHGVAR